MNPPTPHDLGFQDRTRAGYPARITSITEKKICGEYFYCGEWIKNNWYKQHGMIAKDGSYKTDVDLVKILESK